MRLPLLSPKLSFFSFLFPRFPRVVCALGCACILSDRYCASVSTIPALDDRLKSLATEIVKTWKEEIDDLNLVSDSDGHGDPRNAGDDYRWGTL